MPARLDSNHTYGSPDRSIVEVVRDHAASRADDIALTYLVDGEDAADTWTYRELWENVSRVAAHLRSLDADGERALLLYEPGLEYIAAFLGTLAAGAIAVPAYPPLWPRMIERLDGVTRDCAPKFVLGTSLFLTGFQSQLASASPAHWVATDALPAATFAAPALDPDGLTMLQYTSGSTGHPKGVMLSRRNLVANCQAVYQWLGPDPDRRGLIWLPPYHDMGLLGGILQPLFAGFPLVFMSPLHFIQRPARWLKAISKHRITLSGGPNFSYQLCAQQSDEELEGLDLSCWKEAFCGAEPVRPETFDHFCGRMAAYRFAPNSVNPCYGLAESTLIVTGKPAHTPPQYRFFDRARLEQGEVVSRDRAPEVHAMASCGVVIEGYDVRIVDPATGQEQPPGRIGAIWVSGPSVAQGYWNRPELTAETFHRELPGSRHRYLNTGDLGFRSEDQIFVTGRAKDLIIIAGKNHYPEDIEQTVERAHEAVCRSGSAVFAVESNGEEAMVILAEVKLPPGVQGKSVADSIVERVTAVHGIAPKEIVLCKRGSIARTTSGKVRRSASRDLYLAEQLKHVA